MQYVSTNPISQFASLSLLAYDGMVEPIITVAPTASCTSCAAIEAIYEVHQYIKSIIQYSTNYNNNTTKDGTTTNNNTDYISELLREDEVHMQSTIQIYRPISLYGAAIYYLFLNNNNNQNNKESEDIIKLQSYILSLNHQNNNNTNQNNTIKIDPSSKILGVVICVAMTGSYTIYTSSSLSYTIGQRISDCILYLQQLAIKSKSSSTTTTTNNNNVNVQELLTNYLLIDDEWKVNNTMIHSMNYIHIPNSTLLDEKQRTMTSPLGLRITPITDFTRKTARRASTGIIRNVMNQQNNTSSMNVNNNNTSLDGKTSDTNGAVSSQQHPFDMGIPINIPINSAITSRTIIDQLNILSITDQTTFLKKYDLSGIERKANLDLTGGVGNTFHKNRYNRRRNKNIDTTNTNPTNTSSNVQLRDADFDHFDYKGPTTTIVSSKITSTNNSDQASTMKNEIKYNNNTLNTQSSEPTSSITTGKALLFKSSSKDTKRATRRPGTTTTTNTATTSKQQIQSRNNNIKSTIKNSKIHTTHTNMDSDELTYDSKSHSGNLDNSSNVLVYNNNSTSPIQSQQQQQLLVTIALNEDLSCSYKLSQLSSCSVDGIVQIQVKTSIPIKNNSNNNGIPFLLNVKDPVEHIETMNENPKYATKLNYNKNNNNTTNDSVFNIVLPEEEKYFSILKYRCKSDLRPVPIRVQAKVKADGSFCRVALQISSNPNNESGLTDLTIAMGVPDNVRGESVVTQPAGGVWDQSKVSVIWCVSELGTGEKFQLQARFEMKDNAISANDLHFPVFVRCQCLHVQLSSISFDVRNNPERFPAEIVLKVASRFRLSHREKNN